MTQNDRLREVYTDPSHEAGYSGIKKLSVACREPQSDVRRWLLDQESYSLHFPARRRFRRNPVIATSIGDLCQADLVDMSAFASQNDGYRYLLTFIDVFSKQADAVSLTNKTAREIMEGFRKIFEKFIPRQIQTDRGLEFKNKTVLNYMKANGVNLYFSYNQDVKAAVVERFNRTLKSKMFRYFTHAGSRRYIDVLSDLIQSYNNSYHRSIRMRPVEVEAADPGLVFRNLYGYSSERAMLLADPTEKPKFRIGDTVRLRYHVEPFAKGYYPNFTDQTFTVTAIIRSVPRLMYKVTDFENNPLPRKLYAEDMLKIPANPRYRIEKILKRRKTREGDELFVKFLNYPDSANQWIPASAVEDVI